MLKKFVVATKVVNGVASMSLIYLTLGWLTSRNFFHWKLRIVKSGTFFLVSVSIGPSSPALVLKLKRKLNSEGWRVQSTSFSKASLLSSRVLGIGPYPTSPPSTMSIKSYPIVRSPGPGLATCGSSSSVQTEIIPELKQLIQNLGFGGASSHLKSLLRNANDSLKQKSSSSGLGRHETS